MDIFEFQIILLIIYLIAIGAALFSAWMKWDQNIMEDRLNEIHQKMEEINKSIKKIEIEMIKLTKKDPFSK